MAYRGFVRSLPFFQGNFRDGNAFIKQRCIPLSLFSILLRECCRSRIYWLIPSLPHSLENNYCRQLSDPKQPGSCARLHSVISREEGHYYKGNRFTTTIESARLACKLASSACAFLVEFCRINHIKTGLSSSWHEVAFVGALLAFLIVHFGERVHVLERTNNPI